jgi:hypothetical protein
MKASGGYGRLRRAWRTGGRYISGSACQLRFTASHGTGPLIWKNCWSQ